MDITFKLNTVSHPIGMVCLNLALITIIEFTAMNKHIFNKTTVHLVAVIGFIYLLAHFGEYYSIIHSGLISGTPACTTINDFRIFLEYFTAGSI
jgi:hypothetical protein